MIMSNKEEKVVKREGTVIFDVDLTLVTEIEYDFSQCMELEYNLRWAKETLKAQPLDLGVRLLKFISSQGYRIVIMTARDEPGRPELNAKLRELGILHMIDKIMMRRISEYGLPSSVVKGRMITDLESEHKFVFAFDDANHDLYRERGIKIFDANNWNGR
jgi:hypothetical protein